MKVLLADDHPLFLDGLKNLLTSKGIEVIGTARDGLEAFEEARSLKPDLILMDVQMPQLNGLEATRLVKAELPDVKIVMLTMSEHDEDLFEAIRSGASGYLLKTEDTDKFFELLTGLMRGEAPLSPGLAGRILNEFARRQAPGGSTSETASQEPPLTPRQIEVLTLVSQGLTYKEVGAKLFLAEPTIKYHMGEIIERLHVKNRREAIEYARRMKLERK
jgi:two-component system NarL family response regulator